MSLEDKTNSPPEFYILTPKMESVLMSVLYRPRFGLEITETVKKSSGGKINLTSGSLYPTLYELEKRGYLESYWGEDTPVERGGARRKYYKITDEGEQLLEEKQSFLQSLATLKPAWEI
jgi:PadR family transcriptional regulator, regulatory protein PadR